MTARLVSEADFRHRLNTLGYSDEILAEFYDFSTALECANTMLRLRVLDGDGLTVLMIEAAMTVACKVGGIRV